MATRVPLQAVVVLRDGKFVTTPLNEPFEFTDGELEDIAKLNPNAVREPLNEAPAVVAAPAAPEKAPAGKKAAAAADDL